MLSLETIVTMPAAGEALLAAHRWIQAEGVLGTDAFQLIATLGRQVSDGEAECMRGLALIAEADHRFPLVLASLLCAMPAPGAGDGSGLYLNVAADIAPERAREVAGVLVRAHNHRVLTT